MAFIEDLKNGLPGVQFAVPEGWQVHEDQERRAVLLDNERKVGWHLVHTPWRLDLRRQHDEVLRRDIERHARYTFVEQYKQIELPPGSERPPPRVLDPTWSPIIEIDHIRVGEAPALLILRRVAYEPAIEVVLGHVQIPLVTGLCDLTVFHRTNETGGREGALLEKALLKYPGETPQALVQRLGQRYFDDPAHDATFPGHALTLVRGALRWLLGGPEQRIKVTAPMGEMPAGELGLPMASCAVQVPPRYVPLPPGAVPMPRSMVVMTRVLLEGGENPRILDVWHLTDVLLKGSAAERASQLHELIKKNAAEVEEQGVKIDLAVKDLPSEGEQVRASTEMRVQAGAPTLSVSRWMVEPDGQVFRVSISAPDYIPAAELNDEADAVMKSWRRLAKVGRTAWLTS